MSKIGPKSNPSGKQVHTVQVQQGTLVKSTLDFDTITTNIIKKVSRHLPKPNHPEYTRVLEEFKPLLTGHLTANKILSTFHNRLKSDNIALLQALAQNNIENRKGMIEILCQRINSSHFFLNTVIPLFDVDKLYEFKVNLVNILWEDIVALMNNIAFLYEKNISTPAEKIAHFEIAQHYFSLLDIYANDFTTILDDVLFERPTKLSAVIVSEIKRNLFYGYNNFVNIYGDYAFICGFVSQFDDAKKAYVKAKKLFLFLKEHQNPLAACSGEAPDIFKDRVARMEQKLNYLKAAYDDEHPSPLNGLVGTLNTFQEEFQKDLLKLQSSTYVPSPPLTDEEFKRYLKELEQDVQNTKLLLDAIKTEKLEEFSISFRMHLMHTMTYCSQLGNATPLQAKNLLVPIKEIFVLWRKAADSWPGNMTHRRILGIFDSLCRACITASVAIATAGTAKPAALPAPAPAPAPAPSMPLEPAALPSSSLVPKEETLEEKMTKCSQLAKEMQKDVTRLIEKSRTGKIRTSPIPPEVQCERMQAVKQLLLNISEAAEPSTKLGQLIPLITRTKNLIIDINQFIGHNMLSQVLQTASSVLSSLSSLFAVTSTTPDADIVDTLKRTGEAIEEEQRRLEEPPKPEIEVAPTPAPTSPKPIEDKSPEKTSPVLSAPTRRGRTKTSHRHEASTDAPPKEDDNIPVVKEILQFVSLPDVSSEKKLDRMAKKAKKREVKDGAMQALALSKQQKEQEAREKEQARALKERQAQEEQARALKERQAQEEQARALKERQAQEEQARALKERQAQEEQARALKERQAQEEQARALKERQAQEEQARALKEAEAKQQAKIQVDEVTAKLRALQLTPPPALPVYLPNEPTTHTITVSEKVKRILTLINARGYYAVIVGGEVRDKLLGLTPHDSDLLTNCPANELREILGHDYRLSINPFNPNKFDIQDENIDILCSSLPLEEELASRDLCVNTFIADRDGKVYDLLKYIHFLRYKELMLIQSKISPDERFQKDPSLMMRLIRLYSHLKKAIPDLSIPRHYVQYLRKTASFLTCQPFGVYLKNVELLFNQGLARDNFNALNFCGMTHHLFPAAAQKCLTCDMRPFILFLHEKLTNIDLLDEQTRKSQHSSYHFLALLLLPEVINQMVLNLTPTHVDAITQTSNFFCNNYLGKFDEPTQTYLGMTEGEKSCFNMNMKIILKSYYEEYLSNYPRYCQIIYQQSMQQDVLAPEGEMAAAASPVTPAYHQTRQRGAQGRRTPKSDSEVAQQEHKCAGTKAAKK